ncbi:uncharacterized protein LOC129612380 [Condylostylus longicornis]|uniref:uncharacterized protein LOC129612380 n=1 Tax=Condylostylus longicornis TaxID=2530218 RepID=UPI00244E5AED|nr:uncharacterized protein LOC129612380 [Condylostylus longicornis]
MVSYFEKSSIHGFAYLVKRKLHIAESYGFWLTILLISIFFWVIIGLGSVDRYKRDNTVISMEKDFYFWNRTSPSITICPLENRLNTDLFEIYIKSQNITDMKYKENLYKFLESLANSSYDNFKDIEIFPGMDFNVDPSNYMMLIRNLTGDDRFHPDVTQRVALNENSKMNMQQILTEFGICYMINNYFADFVATDYLLLHKKRKYSDPEKELSKMDVFDDISYNVYGFRGATRVFVHNAYDIVGVNSSVRHKLTELRKTFFNFFLLLDWHKSTTKTINIYVYTLDIITAENYEHVATIQQRKCRFPLETNSTHYTFYTKNVCFQECRIEAAYTLCKCIPHFYPNKGNVKRTCNYMELIECISKYSENCKESKIVISAVQREAVNDIFNHGYGVVVYIRGYSVIRYKRQVIFTFEDLLVSIGGTAGFFLGFSVLSIVEVFYFFTLRLYWYTKGYT